MKLVKLLANLGYGSRKEVQRLIRAGAVTDDAGRVLGEGEVPPHDRIRFRGEPLDPPFPLTIILHKPDGFTCSAEDPGETVYDLLPERFAHRNPGLNPIGRLDKDTTGLLLLTDDGKLLHKIIHPKSNCLKVYHATLDRPLEGHEGELFASGTLDAQQRKQTAAARRIRSRSARRKRSSPFTKAATIRSAACSPPPETMSPISSASPSAA